MNSKFVLQTVLTVIFELICVVALIGGIRLIVDFSAQGSASIVTSQGTLVPPAIGIAGGVILALYGLAGLVFAGGVHVLISIDANAQSLTAKLSEATAVLQRISRGLAPAVAGASESTAASSRQIKCQSCEAPNEAGSRYCEFCGTLIGAG